MMALRLLALLLVGPASAAATPATMHAVRAAAPGCSAPDFGCVGLITAPTPTPKRGEVLIKVSGSSCGVTDVVEAGPHPWFPLGPRRILGYNVGGTVAALGPGAGAAALRVGDSVWTMLGGRGDGSGAFAEYVTAAAEGVATIPPTLDTPLLKMATLVGPALTDWFAFAAGGAPWPADRNLTAVIVSGSGGTGYVAVQLVKALGVRRVVTASTGAGTIAWVKSLGADVVVDYKQRSALEAVADDSVDLVYDNHGASGTVELAMTKLRAGGVFVGIVNTTLAAHPKPGVRQLYFDLPDALGNNETRKRLALESIAALVGEGRLRPFVQATYPLEAVPAALAKAAAGGMVSKIGITTDKLPPPQQHHQQQQPPPQQRQQQQSLASRLPTKTDDTTTRAPPPPPQPGPIPQVQPAKYFEQKLDHFNAESGTWTQRYYLDERAWSGAAKLGPLLFIPGGEWSVTPSKGLLYGLVRELAVELGGMAMIAEHRFYGGSIPFNGSVEEAFQPTPARLGLLSVTQAMADYAVLIQSVRDAHGCPDCPVLSFGGSYSGKLSAYLRLKYPTVVDIAHAASAPIKLDSVGLVDPLRFYEIVTTAAEKIAPGCAAAVRRSFAALRAASPAEAQHALGLCQAPTESEFGWNDFQFYITQYFATMAMFNYPPTASPLARDCSLVIGNASTSHAPLDGFRRLLEPHFNATRGCFDIAAEAPADVPGPRAAGRQGTVSCSDWSGCGPGLGGMSWDYQACTQVLQPLGTNNRSDMFPPHAWTESWMTEHCRRRFSVSPGFEFMKEQMGLDAIERWPQPTRIIFSNGLQDPWSAGGVLQNISTNPTIVAITIENSAHHQDLNGGASPSDTPEMLAARAQEKATLAAWLREVQAERRAARAQQ